MAEKSLIINELGNALMLQLQIWKENIAENHGKPVAVLSTATDEDLGKAIRQALATRIRTKKAKEEAPA